ncbi:MAG: hypothetical protein ACYTGW_02835 [Planctomycetota bacterium]
MIPTTVVLLHAAVTLCLTGLIWFVQIVHYPQFARVGAEQFVAYEREHIRRTSRIVAPLMLVELVTAAVLVIEPPTAALRSVAIAGLALLAVVWLSTALLQVPCHRRLEHGFDAAVIRRLVATNWIRTIAWTARSVLALYLAQGVPQS